MKRLSLILLGISLLAQASGQCVDTSNLIHFTHDDRSYFVAKEMKNWTDAAACAVELGGYLVQIDNQEEQDAVLDGILDSAGVVPTYVKISNGGGIAYVWIGATDQLEEGKWIWDGDNDNEGLYFWTGQGANGANDGSAIEQSYINWGGSLDGTPNEPDDYSTGQDHGAIGLGGWPAGMGTLGVQGEWNDIIGSSEIYFVVEFDSLLVPGPDLGLQSAPNHNSPAIYPNPATDILHVEAPGLQALKIVDLYGRILLEDASAKEISIAHLPRGLFVVDMQIQGKNHTELLLIR